MLRRHPPQEWQGQGHGETLLDAALHLAPHFKNLSAPTHDRSFHSFMEVLHALTPPKDVHAAGRIHAVGGANREHGAYTQTLLLWGGHRL